MTFQDLDDQPRTPNYGWTLGMVSVAPHPFSIAGRRHGWSNAPKKPSCLKLEHDAVLKPTTVHGDYIHRPPKLYLYMVCAIYFLKS